MQKRFTEKFTQRNLVNVQLEKKYLKQSHLPRKELPFYNKNSWNIKTILALSFPASRWAGDNTELPSNSNIFKTVRVNINKLFDKLSNGMQVDRLCACGSQVIDV